AHVLGQLHESDVGERNARELGLQSIQCAVVGRPTEEDRRRSIALRIRVVALSAVSRPAVRAVSAADGGWNNHTIANAQIPNAFPDLLDDTHGLGSENRSLLQARHGAAHEVQVGATDRARRDADDGVGVLLDLRLRDVLETDVPDTVKDYCLHDSSVDEI